MNRIKMFVIGLLLIFMASMVFADIAPDPLHQGMSPKPRYPTMVQMESETVNIMLGRDKCVFDLTFFMTNHSDETEAFQVGFPTSFEGEIKDLIVKIDGKPVKLSNEHLSHSYKMGPPGREYTKTSHTYWIVWDMKFQANKQCIVKMNYWVQPRNNENWGTKYNDKKKEVLTDLAKTDDTAKKLLNASRSLATGYILVTGKEWHKTIGKATINVMPAENIRGFFPRKDFKANKMKFTWTFSDFEPDKDLYLEYSPMLSFDEEITIAKSLAKKYTDNKFIDEYIAYLEELFDRPHPSWLPKFENKYKIYELMKK